MVFCCLGYDFYLLLGEPFLQTIIVADDDSGVGVMVFAAVHQTEIMAGGSYKKYFTVNLFRPLACSFCRLPFQPGSP